MLLSLNLAFGNSRGNKHAKFIIVELKFRFTCGELNFHRNTVNGKKVMSLIVEAFVFFDINPAAKKISALIFIMGKPRSYRSKIENVFKNLELYFSSFIFAST